MHIIDKYILKRYLATFSVMLLLFIPIGIVIDVSEKVNKMLQNKVAFSKIALYYFDFTVYFANLLFPIFLFLSAFILIFFSSCFLFLSVACLAANWLLSYQKV